MSSVKRSLRFQDDDEKLGVDHDIDVSSDREMPRKDMRIVSPMRDDKSSQAASSGLNTGNGSNGNVSNGSNDNGSNGIPGSNDSKNEQADKSMDMKSLFA